MQQKNLFSSNPNALNKYFISKVAKAKQPKLEEMFKAIGGFTGFFDPEVFNRIYGEFVKGEITGEKVAYAINRYRDDNQPHWVMCDEKGFLSINPCYLLDQTSLDTPSFEKRPVFDLKDYWYRFEDDLKNTKTQLTTKIKQGVQKLPFAKDYQHYHLETLLERLCLLINIQLGSKNAKERLSEIEGIDYQGHIRALHNYFPGVKVEIDQTILELHQIGMMNFDEMALDGYITHLEKFVSRLDGIGHQVNLNLEPFHQIKHDVENHFKWIAQLNRQFKKLETVSNLLPKSILTDIQTEQEEINQRYQTLFSGILFQESRIAFHESLNNPEREIRSLIDRQKKLIQYRVNDLQTQKKHIQKGKESLLRRQKEYEKLMTQTGETIPFLEVRKAAFERLLKKIEPMKLHGFVEHSVEISTHDDVVSDHKVVSQFAHSEYLDPKAKLIGNIENEIVNCEVKIIEIQVQEKTQELSQLILNLPNLDDQDCLKLIEALKNQGNLMRKFEQSITQVKSHLSIELKLASFWQIHAWCEKLLMLRQNLIQLKNCPVENTDLTALKAWAAQYESLHLEVESSDPDQLIGSKIGIQPIDSKSYQLWSKVLNCLKSDFESLPSFKLTQNKNQLHSQILRQDNPIFQNLKNGKTIESLEYLETVRTMRQALRLCPLNVSIFNSFKALACLSRAKNKQQILLDFSPFEIQQLQVIELILKIEDAVKFLKEFNHSLTNELTESLKLAREELVTAYQASLEESPETLASCYQKNLTQIETLYRNILSNPIDELKAVQKQNKNLNFWKFLMSCLTQIRQSLFGKNDKEVAEEIQQEEKSTAVNTVFSSQASFSCGFFQGLGKSESNSESVNTTLDCR